MALNSYRAAKVFSINPFCAVNYTSFIKKEEWGRRGKRRGESFLLLFFGGVWKVTQKHLGVKGKERTGGPQEELRYGNVFCLKQCLRKFEFICLKCAPHAHSPELLNLFYFIYLIFYQLGSAPESI